MGDALHSCAPRGNRGAFSLFGSPSRADPPGRSVGKAVRVLHCSSMNKDDAKEIKSIIDTALETHLGSVHEEISDLRTDLSELEERLTGEIDKIDAKLGAFENNEIDKRLQLEVRVTRIEKHVGIPKSA
jgi:hypothetical protein